MEPNHLLYYPTKVTFHFAGESLFVAESTVIPLLAHRDLEAVFLTTIKNTVVMIWKLSSCQSKRSRDLEATFLRTTKHSCDLEAVIQEQ